MSEQPAKGSLENPYTYQEWLGELASRFGDDPMQWRFRCPVCEHEATVQDYKDAGAPEGAVAFSCVGRWIEGSPAAFGDGDKSVKGRGPCDYSGGGFFQLNPVFVDLGGKVQGAFEFGAALEEGGDQ